jgi:hypothetical protein
MINGPPRRMGSCPDGLDPNLAVDLDHQATIHYGRRRVTALELSLLLSDSEPGVQECTEILAHKCWSFPWHCGEEVFSAMRSREYEHAVQIRVHSASDISVEPIPHE